MSEARHGMLTSKGSSLDDTHDIVSERASKGYGRKGHPELRMGTFKYASALTGSRSAKLTTTEEKGVAQKAVRGLRMSLWLENGTFSKGALKAAARISPS